VSGSGDGKGEIEEGVWKMKWVIKKGRGESWERGNSFERVLKNWVVTV
jgi:hypothetical protein